MRLAEILDLTLTGVLHAEVAREAILNQIGPARRGGVRRPRAFRPFPRRCSHAHQDLPPGRLAALAVVKGFERKWR